MSWLNIHAKVKALGIAVAILVTESIVASLNGTISWHATLIADATGVAALAIAYLKGSGTPAS